MRKKNNFGLLLLFIILISICIGFVLLSSKFEQNIPTVEFENNGYWNLKDKLKIILKDDTGIIYYKITFKTNKNSQILENKILKINQELTYGWKDIELGELTERMVQYDDRGREKPFPFWSIGGDENENNTGFNDLWVPEKRRTWEIVVPNGQYEVTLR